MSYQLRDYGKRSLTSGIRKEKVMDITNYLKAGYPAIYVVTQESESQMMPAVKPVFATLELHKDLPQFIRVLVLGFFFLSHKFSFPGFKYRQ